MEQEAAVVALWFSVITWVISLALLLAFDRSTASYQFVTVRSTEVISEVGGGGGGAGAGAGASVEGPRRLLGVDGLSILFVRLTTRLRPLCILSAWSVIVVRRREFFSLFLLRESRILVVFRARDLLLFYLSFEAVLIPRFLLVGVWGSRERKVRAANRFFLYTLFGSVWRLLALLLIYFEVGSRDFRILSNTAFTESRQRLLWLAFFVAFAVKVPRMPFHIWLPEAHVESPTAGSVVLAALLLKFGLYAFVRRSLPLFPLGTLYFTPLVQVRAVLAVVYTSLTARRQTDRKRIIAYSSVAHRNLGLLGVFSCTLVGLEGSIFLGLSHGIVSGALFLCVGVLYDRYHSRVVSYYGGLAQLRPRYVAAFRLFTRANIGLPGTSSFVGELRILVGAFLENSVVAVLGATGRVLGGGYSLWLLNRVAFGNLKTSFQAVGATRAGDRGHREFVRRAPLVVLAVVGGIGPQPVLERIHTSCLNILAPFE
jgi:proton-translocating NADH-quinone oxidoreductase chain M